jgi:hypothetical protein
MEFTAEEDAVAMAAAEEEYGEVASARQPRAAAAGATRRSILCGQEGEKRGFTGEREMGNDGSQGFSAEHLVWALAVLKREISVFWMTRGPAIMNLLLQLFELCLNV